MEDVVTKAILQSGAFGLLAWLVYTLFKQALPSLVKSFEGECEKQRDMFRGESASQRKAFEQSLEMIRGTFVVDLQKTFASELRLQRNDFQEELSKQRHAFVQVINALNLNNHELVDQLRATLGDEGKGRK